MRFQKVVSEVIEIDRVTWILTVSRTDAGVMLLMMQRVGRKVQRLTLELHELDKLLPALQKLRMFKNARRAGR